MTNEMEQGQVLSGMMRKQSYSRQTSRGQKRLQEQYNAKSAKGFTAGEVDEFRQVFDFYDIDNNNIMNLNELDNALRSLGYNPSDEEVDQMLNLMDVDGDRTVDFEEFCMIMEYIKECKGKYGEIRDSFRCLDLNGDGKICCDSLLNLLTNQPDAMDHQQAGELIKFADSQDSGTIDYEAFVSKLCAANLRLDVMNYKQSGVATNSEVKPTTSSSQSERKLSTQSASNDNQHKEKKHGKKKTKNNQPNREVIDTVAKALGGPILLNSAVIITSQAGAKKTRWPSLSRILKNKRDNNENAEGNQTINYKLTFDEREELLHSTNK